MIDYFSQLKLEEKTKKGIADRALKINELKDKRETNMRFLELFDK